jgi:hypothetical protein
VCVTRAPTRSQLRSGEGGGGGGGGSEEKEEQWRQWRQTCRARRSREALRGAGAVCLFNRVARAARVC